MCYVEKDTLGFKAIVKRATTVLLQPTSALLGGVDSVSVIELCHQTLPSVFVMIIVNFSVLLSKVKTQCSRALRFAFKTKYQFVIYHQRTELNVCHSTKGIFTCHLNSERQQSEGNGTPAWDKLVCFVGWCSCWALLGIQIAPGSYSDKNRNLTIESKLYMFDSQLLCTQDVTNVILCCGSKFKKMAFM